MAEAKDSLPEMMCPICGKAIILAQTQGFLFYTSCKHTIHVECLARVPTPQACPKCKQSSILASLFGGVTTTTPTASGTPIPETKALAPFTLSPATGTFPHITQLGVTFIARRPIPTEKGYQPSPKLDPRIWVIKMRPTIAEMIRQGVTYEMLLAHGMTLEEWTTGAGKSLDNLAQLQMKKV